METWHNVQDSDLQVFMKLDQYLIRQIVGSHSKVPIEFLYLETSAIPVDFILTSRRLNYLHTVLSRSDSEMTKRRYLSQKSNPIKGNWVHHIKEDLEKVGIIQDDNEISAMKKSAFKSLVKKNVRTATFNALKRVQLTHIKINTILYEKFLLLKYLDSDNFSKEEKSMLFNIRANSVNGFKTCTPSIYRNNLVCKLGCCEDDSLHHCMICPVIDQQIGKTSARLSDMFETTLQQHQAVSIFIKRNLVRTALIEGSVADQGANVLDTSTPASAGGAGERIGLPDSNPTMPFFM